MKTSSTSGVSILVGYQRVSTGFEKALGPDRIDALQIIYALCHLYSDQGMLDKAEAMFQRELTGREKTLCPDHTDTLTRRQQPGESL